MATGNIVVENTDTSILKVQGVNNILPTVLSQFQALHLEL